MKIGFFYQYTGDHSIVHLAIAENLLKSARKYMPGTEIWQLTDGTSPQLEGIDGVKRLNSVLPMAVRRMSLHSQCEGEWLFVDTDVVIQKDVSDVFDSRFDVALTNRDGTITNEAKYAEVMPYNIGVVFSRSPAFWISVKEMLLMMPLKLQEWTGDQLAVAHLMKIKNHFGFDVKILPGLDYNYPPRSADDERTENASIVHYKGQRKLWIKEAA